MYKRTEQARAVIESCNEFKDYQSIDEYITDIRQLLMLGVINRKYVRAEAEQLINYDMEYIKKEFANKIDAFFTTVDIGFSGG